MRRVLAWLCLILGVAGPFASQARVAYGLMLARSEIGSNVLESGQEVDDEEYDGRDMVSVITASNPGPAGLIDLAFPPLLFSIESLSIISLPESPGAEHITATGRWKWPPLTARQRCALLQTLLI